MLRSGPIAFFLHGFFEYLAAAAGFAAPSLFGFGDAASTWSYVVGVAFVVIALTADGPVRVTARIPLAVHVALDYLLAAVLVASPWLLGFDDQTAPMRWFVALGIAHLLVTMGTRYIPSGSAHVGSLAAGTSVTVEAEGSGPGAGR